MRAEYLSDFLVNHQLYHAFGLVHGQCLAACRHREATYLDGVALLPCLRFGKTETGHLWPAVDGPWYLDIVQRLGIESGNALDGRNALRGRNVRQEHLSGNVAYRVDVGDVRAHGVVNGYESALGLDSRRFQSDSGGIALNTHGDQNLVVLFSLDAFIGGDDYPGC